MPRRALLTGSLTLCSLAAAAAVSSELGSANHHHEEQARSKAPVDQSTATAGKEQVEAYDRAIAPYVVKARASYPSAKKRYLAGLPSGYTFAVWIRLYQNDEKTRENRH